MNDTPSPSGFFAEVVQSEVVPITCARCGCETVVNKVYVPYLIDNQVGSCRRCRDAEFGR
jgi:hypothetical protein